MLLILFPNQLKKADVTFARLWVRETHGERSKHILGTKVLLLHDASKGYEVRLMESFLHFRKTDEK